MRLPSQVAAPAPSRPAVVRLQNPELPPADAVMAYYELSQAAGFYSNGGPCARLLAERLEGRLGGEVFAIPVANCTSGLMVALRAAIGAPDGPRRLVLTPSYTFTATACAIEWAGFETAFVDVEARGWHLDPDALEAALERYSGQVAGVLACATFGTAPPPAQRAAWRAACEHHGVPLLIDSAPGFGALDQHGRPLGALGDTEIFSFHATKPFAIGEGGLVVTPDPDLAAAIARLINFGLRPGTRSSDAIGFNAKMSELHAATALAMLDRFDDVLARRRRSAHRLRAALRGTPLTYQHGAGRSTWQIFHVLTATPEDRAHCLELAAEHGVEVRTMHEPPLHCHPAFADRRRDELAVTEQLAARALALPMANDLSPDAVARIAGLIRAL
jgi:dTDP-4-amino-4,6-dideoxygalactose transaminase